MKSPIRKLQLKTPIILGSCDLFISKKNVRKYYKPYVGAIVLKTTTKRPRKGYKQPQIARFGDGMLVASGLANPGIKKMCQIVKELKGMPLIGSVADPTLAKEYEKAGVIAVELNLSCPHMPGGSIPAHDKKLVYDSVKLAKETCKVPIIAKLTSWNCNILETALAAEQAGADAIVVSNLFSGTGYYTGIVKQYHQYKLGECLLGHGHGAYTGRNFLSGVLWMIKQLKNIVNIPIIATGGCCYDLDCLVQSFMAGASAVETVTPLYQNKNLGRLYQEYIQWRKENDF